MKILHTSDWHIGRSLYGRKRYDEFSTFLNWLIEFIKNENIDVLLVAGDIFDNTTPSNRAQQLYYQFLCRVSASCCNDIVIIAGNHDSPSFLNAPKELLRALNVHIVGSISENLEDQVIVINDLKSKNYDLKNKEKTEINPKSSIKNFQSKIKTPQSAIICAVPYLRDRDIRIAEVGESLEDKKIKLVKGIKNHYAKVCEIAQKKQKKLLNSQLKILNQKSSNQQSTNEKLIVKNLQSKIPIIAMGHLFAAGGKTIDKDGVRELYVGSLAYLGIDVFPECIDYLALGHLHVPQKVGKLNHIRYSGSPIPMGYGEAAQEKSVVIIDFKNFDNPDFSNTNQKSSIKNSQLKISNHQLEITLHKVPCFQPLERISGEINEITQRIAQLKENKSNAWLEIEYTGAKIASNLKELIDEKVTNTDMEVSRIKNKRIIEQVLGQTFENKTLDDLDVNDVFIRLLNAHNVLDHERLELLNSYQETIKILYEE
ncbi:MAG: exonuclease sbcCD subunit D [Desulfobacteraceae bacterium 4572_130]|nr:MAG: exonuclease sbcCD subunit D [Desulfobacteraceae bacterium 4572_130]